MVMKIPRLPHDGSETNELRLLRDLPSIARISTQRHVQQRLRVSRGSQDASDGDPCICSQWESFLLSSRSLSGVRVSDLAVFAPLLSSCHGHHYYTRSCFHLIMAENIQAVTRVLLSGIVASDLSLRCNFAYCSKATSRDKEVS